MKSIINNIINTYFPGNTYVKCAICKKVFQRYDFFNPNCQECINKYFKRKNKGVKKIKNEKKS